MSRVLRERREDLAREVADIAKITRIKGSYLKAIEEEEYEKLPVEVYTRGYIKEYAEFLGIPSDVALGPYEKYLESKKAVKGKESTAEKFSIGPLTKESHEDMENIRKILMAEEDETGEKPSEEAPRKKVFSGRLLWIIPVVLVAVSIYLLMQGEEKQAPPVHQEAAKAPEVPVAPPAPPAAEAPEVKGPAEGKAPVETTARPQETQAVKPESATPPAGNKKYNLDIAATERTWIQLIIDGSGRKEILLNPGEKINYGADKAFNLKIGNAAGVVLRYNGKELKNLGKQGEVITMSFPEQKLQHQVQQKPEPVPGKEPGDGKAGVTESPDSQNTEPSKP